MFKLTYNQFMKKLLLLIVLSFFSTQGFTASCPDGSEPTKSVSEDGTYFVYNCGTTNSNSNAGIGLLRTLSSEIANPSIYACLY